MPDFLIRDYYCLLNYLYHLLYHSLSWSYDLVAWLVSFGNWRNWINTALPYLVGPKILELGFGTGQLQRALLGENVRIFGIDESFQMCLRVKKGGRWMGINGYAHSLCLVRGVAQSLPFPDHTFNSIVSTFPSNYIFNPHTLREISRVLFPGGRLVIVLSAALIGKGVFSKISPLLFRLTVPPLDWQLAFLNALSNEHLVGRLHWVDLPTSQVGLFIGEKIIR